MAIYSSSPASPMRWSNIAYFQLACVAISLVMSQQTITQCQQMFLQNVYQCVQSSGMDISHFLWLVSNTSSPEGKELTGGDTFRDSACSMQGNITQCGLNFYRDMMHSPNCSTTKERDMVTSQFRGLFGTYDKICAHPCRSQVVDELKGCYPQSDLDKNLFLTNSSMDRGAVIGSTKELTALFCKQKDPLINCMKKVRDNCPDSRIILNGIGLDIESMEKGIDVLCRHRDIYLAGIDCFEEKTKPVLACEETQMRAEMHLVLASQRHQVNETEFTALFCGIRLEHVDCELDGWRKKTHASCTPAVIGLRNELECKLLPDNCVEGNHIHVKDLCNEDKYKRDMRPGSAMSPTLSMTLFIIIELLIVYRHL